jgi:hypothetical protein
MAMLFWSVASGAAPNKIAYELQERCGKQASTEFRREFGVPGKPATQSGKTTIHNYRSHYNSKLNACIYLIRTHGFDAGSGRKPRGSAGAFEMQVIFDINENKEIGSYFKFAESTSQMDCRVEMENLSVEGRVGSPHPPVSRRLIARILHHITFAVLKPAMNTYEQLVKRETTIVTELENQSDRGAAIVGASWVEEALQLAIDGQLVDEKKVWKRLFDNSGPLATFSSKIDLARLLGIIDHDVYSDLHIIRDIRNGFAHSVAGKDHEALVFSTPHIGSGCLRLKSVQSEGHTNPRMSFVRACAVLNSDLFASGLSGLVPVTVRRAEGTG